MAKKGKKGGVSLIVSIICLVLSVLLITTFFMPTFTEGADEKVSYNGVTLTQAMFMSEDDAEEAALNAVNALKYNEDERADYARLVAAYEYAHDEDNAGFATTIVLNWFVLLVGVVGTVLSVLNLLGKDLSKALIGVSAVGVVLTIVVAILATGYAKYVYDEVLVKDWATLAAGAGVWVALASSVLTLGTAVTGKILKK
ncbi:MAG: hypothetical protein IJE91_01480 [Clostridia bacterium]|nr:hypothetical protein [Clostridia bacterium]